MYWLFSSFVPFLSFFFSLFSLVLPYSWRGSSLPDQFQGWNWPLATAKAQSPKHWTIRELLTIYFLDDFIVSTLTTFRLLLQSVFHITPGYISYMDIYICLHLFFAKTIHNPQIPNKGDWILYLVLYIPGTLYVMIIPWESPGFMPHFLALESPFLRINFFQLLLM